MSAYVKFGERTESGELIRQGTFLGVTEDPVFEDGQLTGSQTLILVWNEIGQIEFWDTKNVEKVV